MSRRRELLERELAARIEGMAASAERAKARIPPASGRQYQGESPASGGAMTEEQETSAEARRLGKGRPRRLGED